MTYQPNWLNYWQSVYQSRLFETDLQQKALPSLELNANLSNNVQVNCESANWVPSPASGVQRILLERQGGETTLRATSLVAYGPNSYFDPHAHPLGEEFLVLAGTFSDEFGDYPAGTYVRNPPGSQHAPFSHEGCLILVKLQQMHANDKQRIVKSWPISKSGQSLMFDDYERVSVWQSLNEPLQIPLLTGGIEGLVIAGSVKLGTITLEQGQWFRFAADMAARITLNANSILWQKNGHLKG